jgi:hypothetical protein
VQAHPFSVEFGAGLTRSAPLGRQELLQIKGGVAFQHDIDRPCEFVRQDTEGFAFVMLFLQLGQILLPRLVPPQEECGRFRKGPFKVGVADLVPRRAQAFAPGFFRTLDEATRRREILHPREAVDLVNFVEQDEAQDFANARDGL